MDALLAGRLQGITSPKSFKETYDELRRQLRQQPASKDDGYPEALIEGY